MLLWLVLTAQTDASVLRKVEFGGRDEANAVTSGPDGTILVAGDAGPDAAVARLRLNGSLDRSFGVGGRV